MTLKLYLKNVVSIKISDWLGEFMRLFFGMDKGKL